MTGTIMPLDCSPPRQPNRIDQHILDDMRARDVPAIIARHIALKKAGRLWQARCPFHDESSPSFIVYPDHFHCFGCGAHGDGISFVMRHRDLSFPDAVAELAGARHSDAVTEFERRQRAVAEEYAETGARRFDSDAEARGRMVEARAIWHNALPIAGTLAERYLRGRGIARRLPESLRFSPALYFGPARRAAPALVAALQDSSGYVTAVQRIFLDPTTATKAEPAAEAKRTKGPMHDGAVRLGRPSRILGIAEGIETALSAAQIYSLPVWSALGAQRMKSVWLPPQVEEVMIFRDCGDVGFAEAVKAAEAFESQGRHVFIEPPPKEFGDWNDVLTARGAQR